MILNQKTAFLGFFASALLVSGDVCAQDYELVWSDEFDGNSLSLDSWEPQIGSGTAYGLPAGWGNNELQYYTNLTSNVTVSNGTLKIIAREQSFGGRDYTSARIRTIGMHEFLYGRIEGRMKIPSTSGVWPAFWMLPTNSPYGGWAASGEIDIMESVNNATNVHGTIHFGSNYPENQSNGGSFQDGTNFGDDFHTYAIEWEPDQIRWYIDGHHYHTVNSDQWFTTAAPSNPRAPFDSQFHLILNVAVGGNWPGNPNGSAQYPQTLEVDYVRVYQLVQSPFGTEPITVPGRIEAEDFDFGTQGQSYHDCDPSNNGGAYRETGVDIQNATEGGFNIGWICEGEWTEYTVNVEQAGTYELEARVASLHTGGSFHIEVDGESVSESIDFGSTGGWQIWESVFSEVQLEAGEQVVRFVNDSAANEEYNLNWMELSFVGGCSLADLAEPYGQLNFFDISEFLGLFSDGDPIADFNEDGNLNFFDVSEFLSSFNQGCP